MNLKVWSLILAINITEMSFADKLQIKKNSTYEMQGPSTAVPMPEKEIIDKSGDTKFFDPEGSGYDMDSAKASGMKPIIDPEDGLPHYGSVIETTKEQQEQYGLPEESYMLLKGKTHETWDKAVQGEAERGFRVKKFGDRYYSVPAEINKEGKDVEIDQDSSMLDTYADYIAGYEGFKSKAYKPVDTEEYYTIGYGHYGEDVDPNANISKEEAKQLLAKDIKDRLPTIKKKITNFDKLSPELKKNIVSSWFRGSLSGSPKTIRLINEGKFKEASKEFLNNDEYKNAEALGKRGIIPRMDATAKALANEVSD